MRSGLRRFRREDPADVVELSSMPGQMAAELESEMEMQLRAELLRLQQLDEEQRVVRVARVYAQQVWVRVVCVARLPSH